MSGFPEEIYGKCPECQGGKDKAVPGDGYSTSDLDTSKFSMPLFLYKGRYICQLCIKRFMADDESMAIAQEIAEQDKFRKQAGFRKTMEA